MKDNSLIPLGISRRAWNGNGSRRKLLCSMERLLPARQFFRALLDCPAFDIKAGLRYVRLVGSRDVRYESIRARRGTRTLKVWGDGLVAMKSIPEVSV